MGFFELEEKGYVHIIGFTCFLRIGAWFDDFQECCTLYPDSFSMTPYGIHGQPLLNGYYVTFGFCQIKEVTRQCFSPDWWYDHAYLVFIEGKHFLWVKRMHEIDSYIEELDEDRFNAFAKEW